MRIILLGPPGAGKGTHAGTISALKSVPHVASGDLFRKHQQEETELGVLAASFMSKGELVPDEITISMIEQRLGEDDCRQGIILDGFPRTVGQATALDDLFDRLGTKLDLVLYIAVAEGELVKRLGGRITCRNCQTPYNLVSSPPKIENACDQCNGELYQRTDDTAEAVKQRIQVFTQQTIPLVDYYTSKGLLTEIDGEQDISEVQKALIAAA
jgi:adenylate kinase